MRGSINFNAITFNKITFLVESQYLDKRYEQVYSEIKRSAI